MTKEFHILLVEDNHDLIEIISLILQSHFSKAVKIHHAENITNAKQILNSRPIDLLICDHQLSHSETGADLLGYLKSSQLKTKFVLCSSYTPDQFPELYPSGACYFNIQKPEINEGIEKLIEKIERTHATLSTEINYDYNEKSLAKLSDQLNQIISSDDVPLDRKIVSSYLHAIQEVKNRNIIPESFVFNKNLIQNIITQLCNNHYFSERYLRNPNEYLFPIYHAIFISIVTRRIDADALTIEGNLYLMSFMFNTPFENLLQTDLIKFDFATLKKEISEISESTLQKPKSQAASIFYITQKLTEHFLNNDLRIDYADFKNNLLPKLATSAFYTEVIKILDSYLNTN